MVRRCAVGLAGIAKPLAKVDPRQAHRRQQRAKQDAERQAHADAMQGDRPSLVHCTLRRPIWLPAVTRATISRTLSTMVEAIATPRA